MYIQEIRQKPVDSYGDVRTLVRGLPYQCPDDWQEVLASLDESSKLYLVKEPDNPKDELAIAAYLDDRRVGYVAADDNCKVWMFLSDERISCKLIQKYEASFKVSFENPKMLFEHMAFEDIYKDKDGWIEKERPIMEVPFLREADDEAHDWFRTSIIIRDFEEFVPDFRRKLAAKMIIFVARKNSHGNYRYYLPYLNAAVAVVEEEMLKGFIDTDGFFIAIPDVSLKTYPGGIHIDLYVARIHQDDPLISRFKSVEQKGNKELVFYLNSGPTVSSINEEAKPQASNANQSSMFQIEIDFYNQIDRIATDLDYFVINNLLQSKRVLRYIHKHPIFGHQYDDLDDYKNLVKIFVMKDVCTIYEELNCSISAYKKECQLIYLYTLKVLEFDAGYNIFKEISNRKTKLEMIRELRELTTNFIKDRSKLELSPYHNGDFLMRSVLETENIEMMDLSIEYMKLMGQFASAVANAKGNLTEKESKWLSQIR